MSLAEAITAADLAQPDHIGYTVKPDDCPLEKDSSMPEMGWLTIGRPGPGSTYIRINHGHQDRDRPKNSFRYREIGYATRIEFARDLEATLPAFYPCETFHFIFRRQQPLWRSKSDSFQAKVDRQGRIKSITDVKEHVE